MAHIVHVLKWYPPSIGGIERVAEFCADAARSAGHEVTVIVCEKDAEKAGRTVTPTGVVVYRLKSLGILFSMPIAPPRCSALRIPQGRPGAFPMSPTGRDR